MKKMTLSGDLPPLRTAGNKIISALTGVPVCLRGVNRSGLEYSSPGEPGLLARAGISLSEFDQIAQWGVNIVRLPFTQAWALETPDYDPERYRCAIDETIQMAAQRGMYTLLDLQWLNSTTPRGTLKDDSPNFVPPLPDRHSLDLWRQLARRYRNESAVLYDIFNEPHTPLPDDDGGLDGIRQDRTLYRLSKRRVGAAEWHPWAAHLVNIIRDENPAALIFVSGIDWGYDLHDFPLPDVEGIVYSSHVYPSKKNWDRAFGRLSRTHPVFIAEWGGHETSLGWGHELVRYLDERKLGWTAWSWSDRPHLVEIGSDGLPTRFGEIVRASLKNGLT